jgi:glutamate-1-semialdehyde 2,1-aminomutase
VARLKRLSGMEEVRFHLSGTEALVAAAHLARVNTGKPLIVTFGHGAHGWMDGGAHTGSAVGVALGEERYACDVLTLREMSAATLKVVRMRGDEIAAVLVNPLHGLLASPRGADASKSPSRAAAMAAEKAGGSATYRRWLHELRATCELAGVPLIFDESGTGFRLARGGAQEYFGVRADAVCYGKALGCGLPLGVLCGSARLLANSAPHMPLRAGTASGCTALAEDRLLMSATLGFLRELDAPARADGAYVGAHDALRQWVDGLNDELLREGLPLSLCCEASVWSLRFTAAGRYHWLLQYLLRDEGAQLTWLGPGRLGFPPAGAKLEQPYRAALLRAARRMKRDGWWAEAHEVELHTDADMRTAIAGEAIRGLGARMRDGAWELLRYSAEP